MVVEDGDGEGALLGDEGVRGAVVEADDDAERAAPVVRRVAHDAEAERERRRAALAKDDLGLVVVHDHRARHHAVEALRQRHHRARLVRVHRGARKRQHRQLAHLARRTPRARNSPSFSFFFSLTSVPAFLLFSVSIFLFSLCSCSCYGLLGKIFLLGR